MTRTHDQQRFTISEVAADWHELMLPQHIMLELRRTRDATSRLTTAPVSNMKSSVHPLTTLSNLPIIFHPTEGRRLSVQ